MSNKILDLVIVGGGPAGAGAAVYAGRKKLNTVVIKPAWGGQSVVSTDINNWIGTKAISGEKLAKDLQEHVEEYKSNIFEIVTDEVVSIQKVSDSNTFKAVTKNNAEFITKAVLITTGSNRKTLDIPGAKEFEHKGLTYCASCDGLFFADMDVVVVGAGNAGLESALQLSAYCRAVTILIRGETIRADELTVEAARKFSNIKLMFKTTPIEVLGDKTVTGLKVNSNGVEEVLNISGIFVEIGQIPNTGMVKDLVTIDAIGKIEIDPWTGRTSESGIWAAGDCTNIKYHQNNIAVGEGIKALEDIYQYIKQN